MSSRTPAGSRPAAAAGGGRRRAAASGANSTPMHVRMIQEQLARAREEERRAEERRLEEEARRAEEERRAKEEAERRAEVERRAREEKRRKRQEEGRKREEQRRIEDARRRLGIAVPDAAANCDGGSGTQRRPVYESRKSKSQPKRHANVQSEASLGETRVFELELAEEQITQQSSEGSSGIDNDDAWENKSLDEFDVQLHGKCPRFGGEHEEETEEKHRTSDVTNNSMNLAEQIAVDEVSMPLVEGSTNGTDRELRAPICCILGHVDAGKTKLLDCIRRSNVQGGEAGGITQQIGATYLPVENIRKRTSLKAEATIKVPGLLVIDTPGHQSFSNMRLRGSSLCDIAVVAVDITRGLEKQTIESLDLLKHRNVRFIVALNKVDRLYGWKTCPNAPIAKALKNQSDDVQKEFKWRVTEVVTQLKGSGFNSALYYENKKVKEVVNIVPTSSVSGEGIPDLLLLLVRWVPEIMMERLTYVNTVECTVLEVNEDKDFGTTIDVVLINGALRRGDRIVVCTKQGPVTTNIRYLLTPYPMKELKVKGVYKQHEELKAAQGIKIAVRGLQHAIAGTALIVVKPGNDLERAEAAAVQEISKANIKEDERGENDDCTGIQEISRIKTFLEGIVKVGTPVCVCVPSKDRGADMVHSLGKISSMKTSNDMPIESAKNGVVSIKIIGENPQERSRLYGRHFNADDELLSQISRKSIDVLKEHYRDEMSDENWQLIRRLKKQFGIP
ncbi:Eukaryotic translation initiation factor 5B [Dichanthelium oligosanthes]|uniref:Eukaryotic translation initiation factor 5B n=1 Tax=Dichanthelium oligosanthes TaxID=888268 RepID=A0A1E5VXD6_9POAL|nr:Eukaryotic translation initiation factor 5B [Dichanthelium oligosanthes]